MDSSRASERLRSMSKHRSQTRGRRKERDGSEERELSQTPQPGEGYRNIKEKQKAIKMARKSLRSLTRDGRLGESDRHVYDWAPKHLFSGKSGLGSADWR